MNYSTENQITVEISFPYFKQGDDFADCKGNLKLFADLHKTIWENSMNMYRLIPEEARPYVKGYGDTHYCTLTGPESVMNLLVDDGFASYQENFDSSEDNDDSENSENSSEDNEDNEDYIKDEEYANMDSGHQVPTIPFLGTLNDSDYDLKNKELLMDSISDDLTYLETNK